MNICILMGSPRKHGNTAQLLEPFTEYLTKEQHTYQVYSLYDMQISPCTACRSCQKDWSSFGCRYQDDMQTIFDSVLNADLIVIATPIYSWYCTAPVKAALDRLVYGMNKYYGDEKGPAIWAGKSLALITTCGYRPDKGADLFEEGMKRYCKHSQLVYKGMLCERDLGYTTTFMSDEKVLNAQNFAAELVK